LGNTKQEEENGLKIYDRAEDRQPMHGSLQGNQGFRTLPGQQTAKITLRRRKKGVFEGAFGGKERDRERTARPEKGRSARDALLDQGG